MSDAHNKLQYRNKYNHGKILDLVVNLTYFSFLTVTLTRHTYLKPEPPSSVFSAYLKCRTFLCACAHVVKSEISLETGPATLPGWNACRVVVDQLFRRALIIIRIKFVFFDVFCCCEIKQWTKKFPFPHVFQVACSNVCHNRDHSRWHHNWLVCRRTTALLPELLETMQSEVLQLLLVSLCAEELCRPNRWSNRYVFCNVLKTTEKRWSLENWKKQIFPKCSIPVFK